MMIKRKKKDLSEREKLLKELEELEIKDEDAEMSVLDGFILFFELLWYFLSSFGFVLLITIAAVLYGSGFITTEDIFSHFLHQKKTYISIILLLTVVWFLFFKFKLESSLKDGISVALGLALFVFGIISLIQERHIHTIAEKTVGYVKPAKITAITHSSSKFSTTYLWLTFEGLKGKNITRVITLMKWMPKKKNMEFHENDAIIIVHPIYSTLSDFILVKNFYPSNDAIKAAKYHPVYYKGLYYKRLEDLPLGVKYVDSVFIYEPAIKSLNLHTYF